MVCEHRPRSRSEVGVRCGHAGRSHLAHESAPHLCLVTTPVQGGIVVMGAVAHCAKKARFLQRQRLGLAEQSSLATHAGIRNASPCPCLAHAPHLGAGAHCLWVLLQEGGQGRGGALGETWRQDAEPELVGNGLVGAHTRQCPYVPMMKKCGKLNIWPRPRGSACASRRHRKSVQERSAARVVGAALLPGWPARFVGVHSPSMP